MSAKSIMDILTIDDPTFATISDVDKNTIISIAQLQVDETIFEDKYDYAVALLSAHILSMSRGFRDGSSGAVSSKKEGELSVNFGTNGGGSLLISTSYGQLFQELNDRCIVTIGINCDDSLLNLGIN
jgi:hypothetical protein